MQTLSSFVKKCQTLRICSLGDGKFEEISA